MLFSKDAWEGLADGSITVTFRRWRRQQVVVGHRYRTPVGIIEVESVEVVDPAAISEADARAAGAGSAEAVRTRLPKDAELAVYRVAFHLVVDPDPRAELAADDALNGDAAATIAKRLARMDAASATGPWTAAALDAIAAQPGVRAPDLAAAHGLDTQTFKRNVRKLKELGLTESLTTGYRLSPRGRRYRDLQGGPVRHPGTYVWASVRAVPAGVEPVVTLAEEEGTTIVVTDAEARAAGLDATFPSAWITLTAQTTLEQVGITAGFSAVLAQAGIACNVVAGVHHDHLFVPVDRADDALEALRGWSP